MCTRCRRGSPQFHWAVLTRWYCTASWPGDAVPMELGHVGQIGQQVVPGVLVENDMVVEVGGEDGLLRGVVQRAVRLFARDPCV